MSVNIRYPNITGYSEKEQITQIKSYLHQLVEQLNYALPTIGSGDGSSASKSTYEVQGGEVSYYELRSLIIQDMQKVEQRFEQLESLYVKDEDLAEAVNDALAEAKESGEFNGPQGPAGPQGPPGEVGVITDEDMSIIAKKVASIISFTIDEETGDLCYEYPDSEVVEDDNINNEVEE